MRLESKVAVVTGGARGIGAAICRRYGEEGARLAVADILADEADALAAMCTEHHRIYGHVLPQLLTISDFPPLSQILHGQLLSINLHR
jgi:NAD(P)-dependent dehydrogenase (short-subunit alcohol dehydrogenase family)